MYNKIKNIEVFPKVIAFIAALIGGGLTGLIHESIGNDIYQLLGISVGLGIYFGLLGLLTNNRKDKKTENLIQEFRYNYGLAWVYFSIGLFVVGVIGNFFDITLIVGMLYCLICSFYLLYLAFILPLRNNNNIFIKICIKIIFIVANLSISPFIIYLVVLLLDIFIDLKPIINFSVGF